MSVDIVCDFVLSRRLGRRRPLLVVQQPTSSRTTLAIRRSSRPSKATRACAFRPRPAPGVWLQVALSERPILGCNSFSERYGSSTSKSSYRWAIIEICAIMALDFAKIVYEPKTWPIASIAPKNVLWDRPVANFRCWQSEKKM